MRRVGVLFAVGLVLLAGCSGLVGDPATERTPTSSDDATSTTTATTMTTAATTTAGGPTTAATTTTTHEPTTTDVTTSHGDGNGDGSADAYPPGYTANGPEGLLVALQQHYTALRPHNYTATFLSDRDSEFSGTVRLDGEAETGRARVVPEGAPIQNRYFENGTTYRRVKRPGDTRYAAAESSYDEFRVGLTGPTLQWLTDVTWTHTETTETDGRTLHQYDVAGINASAPGAIDPETVSNLRGTLVVDDDGVIHEFALRADVEDVGPVRYEYAVSDLDDTTVEAPDWLPAAKERTD